MALTHDRALEVAREAKAVAEDLKSVYYRASALLSTNSNLSIDWGSVEKPEFINEDQPGNIDGTRFTRQQLSNVIGSLATLISTLDQGHMGNVNQLADVA